MGVVPIGPADVVPAEAEQEGLQAELCVLEGQARRITRATEIPDRFILDGGHVDARQITRAQQPRECDGIAAVGLYLVAGLLGDERRGHHPAVESLSGQVAIQAVAARPGFIGKHQRRRFRLEPPNQFGEIRLAGADRADIHGRIGALSLGVRDRDGILVDIQTDEEWRRLRHG